jgi:hypothetical protein
MGARMKSWSITPSQPRKVCRRAAILERRLRSVCQEERRRLAGGQLDKTLNSHASLHTGLVDDGGHGRRIRLALQSGDALTGSSVRAGLETLTDFDTGGITAPITFTPDDHRGNRSLAVFVVGDGVWVQASDPIDLRGSRR